MKKRILCLLLVLSMLLSAVPVYAGAATEQKVTASAVTITAGNTASVTLRAENFSDIATLEIFVYYDTEALTLSGTTNGSMFTNASVSTNTSEAGKVRIAAMSVNSLNGSGTLMTLKFQTKSSCTPGTYPIAVAIGNVYDSTFQPVSLTGANGSVTVNKPVSTETFGLTYSVNKSTLEKGDTLSYQLKNNGSRSFVSGEFILEYDHEIFAFDSVELYSSLTGEGAVYSVNSSVLGQVRVAYANTNPVNSYSLFTLKLTVIADKNGSTTLKAKANNVYRADLSAYLPGSISSTFTLKQKEVIEDHPDVFLRTEELVVGRENASIFYLAEGAGVAAADFSVIYDPAVFRCVSVDTAEGVSDIGGMLIINDNFSDGVIRFSYVNMDAYDAEELALVKIVWEPLQSPDAHYQLQLQGKGVVDTQQNTIPLDYVTDSGCILVRTVIPPVCLEDGRTNYTCACGEGYDVDIVPMLGHDLRYFRAQAVTCTEIGWYDYEACTRCEYTTYNEISALGHDYIYHEAKDPTCLDIGWYAYDTCGRCDYSTYVELAPLGHRVTLDTTFWTDPIQITNNGSIPFVLNDGIYYSNNHNHSSVSEFTITALYNCTLRLVYGVSSESGCDWLYILQNGTQKDRIAGECAGKTLNLQLSMGDVVTIRYRKDGSVDRGSDTGWVELFFNQVAIPSYEDVPADTQNPDCTHAVICSYCDTVIKEALDHDYIHHAAQAVTCTEIGWDAYETCSRCDYSTYVEIPALDHDYIHNVAKVVTCTGIGWNAYDTCSRCDYSTYNEIAALGHDYIHHAAQAPTCTDIGWHDYETCSRCDYTTYEEIPALDHDYIHHAAQAVTCTEIGWDAYETCSRCDYSTYVEIPAPDHDYIHHEAKDPTCLDIGWYAYDTCGRCDYSTYVEIPATGHWLDPARMENDAVYPFALSGNTYASTNKSDSTTSTFTLRIVGACTIVLYGKVSSEANYDKLIIKNNNSTVATLSGEQSWRSYTLSLNAGDTVTITYSKDVSVANGQDTGWFRYEIIDGLLPGDQGIPTCTDAVVCSYCNTVLKEALGHDTVAHAGQVPHCTQIGWHAYETCTRCDYSTYVELPIDSQAHDEIAHSGQTPTCTEIGWDAYETCSRCDYSTYVEIPANGHSFVDKVCTVCGADQSPTQQWDISENGNGSVMAYAYAHMDGTYLLEIVGYGATKNYSSSPFYSLSGKIDEIVISNGVTTIGNSLFYNLRIQGNVEIPEGVTTIGNNAFYGFSGPKTVSLPASITSIGNFAFYGAKNLIVILQGSSMPGSLGSIWDYNCGHYLQPQQIITTDVATYIIDRNGKAWLAKCYVNEAEFVAETSVNGITVTGIGAFAFDQKSNLILYTVPKEITSIGSYAFRECNKLTLIFEQSSGISYNGSTDGPPSYYAPQKVIQMSDRVYVLGNNGQMYLARYIGNSKNVTIESEVEGYPVRHIGNYAFHHKSLDSVTLPDTVQTIGGYAFIHSTVKQVSMSSNLTEIGTWGFFGADLTSITIPEKVTKIYDSVFSYCDMLKTVYVESPTIAKGISSTSSYGDLCRYAQTVVIPATVENAWLAQAYTYADTIADCTVYSNCAHQWQQEIVSEFVVCQNDGITVHTCSTCGVEIKQVQSCHTTVLYDGQAPTCTEIGWESYRHCIRCDYTTYTEIPALGHSFEDHTCTTCGIVLVEHQYYADGEAVTVVYETLENALNQATSGTIKLLADTTVSTLVIPSGVTLDLNKKQLTADIVVVMNNATILDGGTGCTGGGKLKIQKENLVLAQGDRSGIIPIWNGVDGYVFTRVTFQQMARAAGTGASQYIFLPRMSNAEATALLANGGLDNELRIQVCLTWNNGKSQQFYTYNDDLLKKVFDGTGRWVFDLKVTGISGIADMIAQPVVTTGTNVQATTTGISITG